MTKGKKFIDKKKAVTYRLVPAEANSDEDAPKYTFVQVSKGKNKLSSDLPPSLFPAETHDETEDASPPPTPPPEGFLLLEEDPDVARALDDDFDFDKEDNILEDDFITKANAGAIGGEKRKRYDSNDDEEDSDEDESVEFSDDLSDDDDAEDCQRKPECHQFSMTSAVPDCSESFKAFNEKFEKFLDLYDEEEIGALEFEEIEGHHSPEELQLRELKNSSEKDQEALVLGNYDDAMKKKILYLAHQPETYVEIVTKQPPQYDCESILSTYSNTHNLPTVIKSEHKVSARTLKKKLTKSNLKKLDKEEEEIDSDDDDDESCDHRSVATTCNIRPKNETPEEKRLRKKIVREARKENRAIKKENKKAFELEKKRQGMQQINALRNAGRKIT